MSQVVVGSYIPSLIEFGLSMTLLFGYGGWHVFLKFKRRETIGHVVWVVCACMFANAVSALIISLGLFRGPLSVWIGFGMIVCFMLLCFPIFLLARGLFVLSPTLSDAAKVHAKQLLALSLVLCIAALLFCLPLPERVVFSFQLAAAPMLVLFLAFFVIRLFQAVKATRAAVEMQNLIPQPRRLLFDVRFKRFLIVALVGVGSLLILNLVFALFAFWLSYSSALPPLALVAQVMRCLIVLGLDVGLGYLFLATPSESLMLFSTGEEEFHTMQEEDSDLFA